MSEINMINEKYNQILDKYLSDNKEYLISTRHHLHSFPELSGKEYETAKFIEKELDSYGISHERVGETGVYAEIDSKKKGKTILLRADIDALPIDEKNDIDYKSKNKGVMHACGHDAHTTTLLSACKFLSKNKDLYNGKIKIVFQQGEEIGLGAKIFIKNGYIKDADRSFGLHVSPFIPTGKIILKKGVNFASVDMFKFMIYGKSAHASTPEKGIDALHIACHIIENIKPLIAKKINLADSAIINIGKLSAGTSYNVVAGYAEFEGTVRTIDMDVRQFIKNNIINISKSIADECGGKMDYDWKDNTCVLSNDDKITEEIQNLASNIFGKDNIITDWPLSFAGDDFAEINSIIPGTYAFVGCKDKNISSDMPLHSDTFNIDDDCLFVSSKLMISVTLDFLNQ